MSRRNPAVTRSVIALTLFPSLLLIELNKLYKSLLVCGGHIEHLLLVLVWLFVATGAALWLGRHGANAIVNIVVAPIRRFGLYAVGVFVVLACAAFIIVARYVLDAFPNSGDELAYVLQAQTYAQGRLWVEPPPLVEAFRQLHFLDRGDKWVSQYAPGWAAVLAPASALGLPLWIVNPFIGAATLAAFFFLARRYVSGEGAWIGVLLLGLSSFFILNSGSYFSHSLTALYGIIFALFGSLYIARGAIWSALAAGVCIGLIGLTRTQNVVIFVVPFAITLAMTSERRTGLAWFGLGGAPFLVVLLAFNAAVTGDPLLPVQSWGRTESVGAPSIATIRQTMGYFARLYIWTSPVLLFGYVAALITAIRRRNLNFSDWIMPVTVTVFLLYSSGAGNQYGPRYYFEAWPFAILTILKIIDPILFSAARSPRAAWVSSALIVSLLFAIAYLPTHLECEHRVVLERQDAYTQVESAGLHNALVIIASNVGLIRPMEPEDLVRNGLHVGEQKIIYTRDLGTRNKSLHAQFPGRSIYVYSNGRLERVR